MFYDKLDLLIAKIPKEFCLTFYLSKEGEELTDDKLYELLTKYHSFCSCVLFMNCTTETVQIAELISRINKTKLFFLKTAIIANDFMPQFVEDNVDYFKTERN